VLVPSLRYPNSVIKPEGFSSKSMPSATSLGINSGEKTLSEITSGLASGTPLTILSKTVNWTAAAFEAATVASVGECRHNLAATGLTSTGAAGVGVISNTTSSTFNSATVTKIGIGFNGGASYVGTCNSVQTTFNKL